MPSVNSFEIPTEDVLITVAAPSIGQETGSGTNASTGYNITTNSPNMKITGELGNLYSTGISLDVLLGTPTASGGGSAGSASSVTLSESPQDLVTGIGQAFGSNISIGYTAYATAEAAPNPGGETQTVTYTLTTGN